MTDTVTISDLAQTVTFPNLTATVTIPSYVFTEQLESGVYDLTGADVALNRLYQMALDSGSYVVTGAGVDFIRGLIMASGAGSYTLTGQDIDFHLGFYLATDAGVYSLSGSDAAFLRDLVLSSESGSFAITGQDMGFVRDLIVATDAGVYALTGADVSMKFGFLFNVDAGSYTLAGTAASLLRNAVLTAGAGSYSLTGGNVGLNRGYTLAGGSASYTLTGSDVTVQEGIRYSLVSDTVIDTDNLTNYTFSSRSLGAEAADRTLVIAAFAYDIDSTSRNFSDITVGGVSVDNLYQTRDNDGPDSLLSAIGILDLSTGTSADVVLELDGASNAAGVAIYRVTGLTSSTPEDQGGDNADSGDLSYSATYSAGALILMNAVCRDSSETVEAATLTAPLSEDSFVEGSDTSSYGITLASYLAPTGGTTAFTETPNTTGAGYGDAVMHLVALR